jgi:hypothetical protein
MESLVDYHEPTVRGWATCGHERGRLPEEKEARAMNQCNHGGKNCPAQRELKSLDRQIEMRMAAEHKLAAALEELSAVREMLEKVLSECEEKV